MDKYEEKLGIVELAIPESSSCEISSVNSQLLYRRLSHTINGKRIYYISDIHIEYQLREVLKEISDKSEQEANEYITAFIDSKIEYMVSGIEPFSQYNDLLLIAGDVANSIIYSELFYQRLLLKWRGGDVISVLGNHELWDGTSQTEWLAEGYLPRTVDDIISDYKKSICFCLPRIDSFLLENELYVHYKNECPFLVSENDILNISVEKLTAFLHDCKFIILGGIGFSGLNPDFNATSGLYRKAITSIEEDKYKTSRFRMVYEKIEQCAKMKRVIVLTHTPINNWTNAIPNPNWIYINGHTHHNMSIIDENKAIILSDNQIGYKPQQWILKMFEVDEMQYNPFENYEDGIYDISREQYGEFNRGRGIISSGCKSEGMLYMLKRNDLYMFVLQTSKTLYILAGGQRKRLSKNDPQYYYNNMTRYAETINRAIQPYKETLMKISDEVKRIGGTGNIHGCIVDISFCSHIYLNPFDGKITPYWALDILSREVYESTQKLIEDKEPDLLNKYLIASEKHSIPLIGNTLYQNNDMALATIPQWVFGTEIYEPSRIMKAMQYLVEQNVIRIWNDDVLTNNPLAIE